MSDLRVRIEWRPRDRPLAPVGVAACGAAARAIARRLLARSDEDLGGFAGVGGDGILVVFGESDLLPWADGVVYLGRDPAAAALLLPVTHEPSVPSPLLERALLAQVDAAPPLAVLPAFACVVSLTASRPVARASLSAWLREAG